MVFGYKKILLSSLLAIIITAPAYAQNKTAAETNCIFCHQNLEDERLRKPIEDWKKSIHKEVGIGCHDCHGGDPISIERAMSPEAGFIGRPKVYDTPAFCARCHSDPVRMRQYNIPTDQFEGYKKSTHGRLLFTKRDKNVATCIDCHGSHYIRKVKDINSPVFYLNVPETCGSCHSHYKLMEPYRIPTNQLELYKEGIHGQTLYGKFPEKSRSAAPTCATCHGKHGEIPPAPTEIPNICGQCHSPALKSFKAGPHFLSLIKTGEPACTNCHENHNNSHPTLDKFSGKEKRDCGGCHDDSSQAFKTALQIKDEILKAQESLKRAREGIDFLKGHRRSVVDVEEKYSTALTDMLIIPAKSHSLNLQVVQEQANKVIGASEEILLIVDGFKGELDQRVINYIIVMIMIIAIIALLLAKILSLKRRREVTA